MPLLMEMPSQPTLCNQDELRTSFALAMSAMYKNEVPLYGDLIDIVRQVNAQVASSTGEVASERLDLERHGAIRLGMPHELRTMRRLFAILGLFPVGYYDLSKAGLPMHATAFRPIEQQALERNPFRVFTTLLRPELLTPEARSIAWSQLVRRNIFSKDLVALINVAEEQGGLKPVQGKQFICEAIKTFQWQSVAAATIEDYQVLQAEHPILADIACFNTAHINHLTPRTLDIDESEKKMRENGISVKLRIEGPPRRRNPILLRQTSFLALQEPIHFRTRQSLNLVEGKHRARFGEIEHRGAAVTAKGRKLYDETVLEASERARKLTVTHSAKDQEKINQIYVDAFKNYPDDQRSLIEQGLIFCRYHKTAKADEWSPPSQSVVSLSMLMEQGVVEADPLIYEDFLPLSAAGIFLSNLQDRVEGQPTCLETCFEAFEDRESLEESLGCPVKDPDILYAEAQQASLRACARQLCVDNIIMDF